MQLPLPCELPNEYRVASHADGTPALRVCVILDADEARCLNAWFEERAAELKARRWQGWGIAEQVVRTLCVQIEAFGPRVFSKERSAA